MEKSLSLIIKQLTTCLEATIQARDGSIGRTKTRYRKVAAHIEQSLKSLESALNLIGE